MQEKNNISGPLTQAAYQLVPGQVTIRWIFNLQNDLVCPLSLFVTPAEVCNSFSVVRGV